MIIIDMEMPEKCQWDCQFCASDGGACLVADVETSDVERPSDCPLREISCKNCKHYEAEPLNFCNLHGIVMSADEFCSYAEMEDNK